MTNRMLSEKQIAILTLICKTNPDGSFLDLDQLRDGLGALAIYDMNPPTKEALQFSVRYMVQRGLIEKKPVEKRRGQNRLILAATMEGYKTYRDIRGRS